MRTMPRVIFMLGFGLLFVSCENESSSSIRAKEREEEQKLKDAQVQTVLSKYGEAISLDDIEWTSNWLIEKQNYFDARRDHVFYIRESNHSINVKKTPDDRFLVIAGDLEYDDMQVRASAAKTSMPLKLDSEWDDEWLIVFKVNLVSQPMFHIKSNIDGIDHIVEEDDVGSEVYSEVYLESGDSVILTGELIEFKKLR